jgi:hypothetical protein
MHLGTLLTPLRWLAELAQAQPRISATLSHGICFYAARVDNLWRYCATADEHAVLFLQLTVVLTNESTRGVGIRSVNLRMPPMTEIHPIPCYIAHRQPLVVLPLSAGMPDKLTVFFELDGAQYGEWASWLLPEQPEWQLDIWSVRNAFTYVTVVPSACLDQGVIGDVTSYDDPPVSAGWVRLQ